MDLRKVNALTLQVGRFCANYVRAKVLRRQHILPFLTLYYITHKCNAACEWCSRELQVQAEKKATEANLARAREVLGQIRRLVPTIYITGGEPLIARDIEATLEIAREVGFYPIIMNTNATLLHRHWRVLSLVDTIVVSLHTIKTDELAKTYKVAEHVAAGALENIKEAARRSKSQNTRIMANCVLTADNISGAYDVLDFCLKHGIQLAVVPAIVGQQPLIASAGAAKRATYVRFLNHVIAQKKKDPKSIQGTFGYLRHIRDLKQVDCRPDAILPVSPDGYAVNACDAIFAPLGRIDQHTSVESILRANMDFKARFQPCPDNCLKACYTQPAVLMDQVAMSLFEYLWRY